MAKPRAEKRAVAFHLREAVGHDLDDWLRARHEEGLSAERIRDELLRVTEHKIERPPSNRTVARWIDALLAEAA